MIHTEPTALAPGLFLLPGFAPVALLRAGIERITAQAPLRQMVVPGGKAMSVAISNCGHWGWTSDTRGYRYAPTDPLTAQVWPTMPAEWQALATSAAALAGYEGFVPDACLINSYRAGARMGLHQDRDEQDLQWPIVSVSLGASAQFLWGGPRRRDRVLRLPLHDGDVLVWGGVVRLYFHGVAPVVGLAGPDVGEVPATARFNLTFRKAM